MTILDVIGNISFFNSLTNEQKINLSNISKVIEYPKNGILYYEGDKLNELFFLADGLIKIYKIDKFENEIFLYHIYKNELINEISTILEHDIFCFSNAEFKEEGRILSINYKLFKQHFLSQNILTIEFIEELAKKNQKLQCILNRELVFDSSAKVAFMLDNDLKMFNELKRNEVSFMLHIQPETLSRVLGKLKRSGIIDITHDKIVILEKDELEAIYKGIKI